jgi:phosphoribosylformylglycinamidine (FGAM) synthase PurS component
VTGDRLALMHKLAEELLSNPVIENYSLTVEADA